MCGSEVVGAVSQFARRVVALACVKDLLKKMPSEGSDGICTVFAPSDNILLSIFKMQKLSNCLMSDFGCLGIQNQVN